MATEYKIGAFREYLINEEKAISTVNKYIHDVTEMYRWLDGRDLIKINILEYKQFLYEKYKISSVNSVIASLNSYFEFIEKETLKVKSMKQQRKVFCDKNKELTKEEYERLLSAALRFNNKRLYLIMQTICSSGIRISELKFITVDSVRRGCADVRCKGKSRVVMLSKKLCRMLLKFASKNSIKEGCIFITRSGKPMDRSNIWKEMKKLCLFANVEPEKVYPHNLRHLFARTYYRMQKDIVRLADILGHRSIDTTRIYTIESGDVHRRQIQNLGLVYVI